MAGECGVFQNRPPGGLDSTCAWFRAQRQRSSGHLVMGGDRRGYVPRSTSERFSRRLSARAAAPWRPMWQARRFSLEEARPQNLTVPKWDHGGSVRAQTRPKQQASTQPPSGRAWLGCTGRGQRKGSEREGNFCGAVEKTQKIGLKRAKPPSQGSVPERESEREGAGCVCLCVSIFGLVQASVPR
jgi:hypothetical protein